MMDAEEQGILDEFLAHGRAVRAERARARAAGEAPDFVTLIRGWGGVTLAYRKRLQDAPAYRLNHEEVTKALEEGIAFAENMSPDRSHPGRLRPRDGHGLHAPDARRRGPHRAARPHRAGGRGHRAQHHLREGASGHLHARWQAALLPGLPRREAGRRQLRARAGRERFLHLPQYRRPVRHLLRRQPPALQRQRREGDVIGQARLPACRRALRGRDQGARSGRTAGARSGVARDGGALRRRAAGARGACGPPHADHRRGDCQGARRGASLPPRAVLPSAELRAEEPAAARGRSRRGDADGRHRPHRRVGRSRAGPAVADHARDGRLEPAVCLSAPRRAGRGDGADRHADRDSRRLGRAAGRRRPRQRRAVLDRQGAEGTGQPRDLLRRLQERRRPLQARGHRVGRPIR